MLDDTGCMLQGSWESLQDARYKLQEALGQRQSLKKNTEAGQQTKPFPPKKRGRKRKIRDDIETENTTGQHAVADTEESKEETRIIDEDKTKSPQNTSMEVSEAQTSHDSSPSLRRSRRQPKKSQFLKDYECDLGKSKDQKNDASKEDALVKSPQKQTKSKTQHQTLVLNAQSSAEETEKVGDTKEDKTLAVEPCQTEASDTTSVENTKSTQEELEEDDGFPSQSFVDEGNMDKSGTDNEAGTIQSDDESIESNENVSSQKIMMVQVKPEPSGDDPLTSTQPEGKGSDIETLKATLSSKENIIECPWCKCTQSCLIHFLKHIFLEKCPGRRMDVVEEVIECSASVLNIINVIRDTEEHVRTPSCPLCNRSFKKLSAAKMHHSHRRCQDVDVPLKDPETGVYTCQHCEFTCRLKSKMSMHSARAHKDKHIMCTICNKMFGSFYLLHLHHMIKHCTLDSERQCPHCGIQVKEKYFRKHIKEKHDDSYVKKKYQPELYEEPQKCDQCKYESRNPQLLKTHKLRKHGVREFKCNECESSFCLKMDLSQHIKAVHQKTPEYGNCPHCHKSMLKKNIKTHVMRVHENYKPFVCSYCSKSFQTQFSLDFHTNSHLLPSQRVYKYTCSICEKGFMQRLAYKDHLNMHTGERPYKCGECGKAFKQSVVFTKHKEVHKPKKVLNLQVNLSATDVQPPPEEEWEQQIYACECGKYFTDEETMYAHANTCPLITGVEMVVKKETEQVDDNVTFYVLPQEGSEQEVTLEGVENMLVEEVGTEGVMEAVQTVVETVEQRESEETLDRYLCGHCQQLFPAIEDVQAHLQSHLVVGSTEIIDIQG